MNSTKAPPSRFSDSILVHLLIIYFVAFFIYSNTFSVPFLFDDEGSIQLNSIVQGLDNFFTNGSGYNFLPNRAFGYLTFALNFQFGGLNVAGYHIVNLAIHIINAFLVYSLIRQTFRTPFFKDSALSQNSGLFAFAVALLFVCHPLQTQAVTYIVQRLTSLTTLLFLATLSLHLKWRLAKENGALLLSRTRLPFYILSLITAVLAMKTKEIAFTLPIVVILYEVTFFGTPGKRLLALLTPLVLTGAIIPLTMMRIHKGAGDILSDVSSATVLDSPLSRWEYLCTQFSVIVTYLRLLLFPVNQNLDYDYPVYHSFMELRPLLSFIFLLSLLGAAIYLYARSVRTLQKATTATKKSEPLPTLEFHHLSRLIAFGILWFFITISVESSVIPITDVIFEHRVYLPSIGFLLALVALVFNATSYLKSRIPAINKAAALLLVIVAVTFSGATYARNRVWRNWQSIWHDTVTKSPEKARPHNILGIGYLYAKQYNAALPEFQAAVKLNPNYMEAWFNLGLIYKNLGQYRESISMYQKALALSKVEATLFAKIHCEIGVNYTLLKEFDSAIEEFKLAVKYDPDFVEYRNNYSYALMEKGLVDAVIEECRTVLGMSPGNQRATEMLMEAERRKRGTANGSPK